MVIRAAQVLEVIKKAANGITLVPIFIEYAVPLSSCPMLAFSNLTTLY